MNLPYVYKLTHKETNQFYIGYRSANRVKSEFDLGFKYFSSSKIIKKLGFENFNIEIIAEFFDSKDAYDFEQSHIEENFKDPLCLNKVYFPGNKRFMCLKHSQETKQKISKAKQGINNPNFGKTISEETKQKMRDSMIGFKNSEGAKRKMSITRTGKALSERHVRNQALAHKKYSLQEELMIFAIFKSGMSRKEILLIFNNRTTYMTIGNIINKFKSSLLKTK